MTQRHPNFHIVAHPLILDKLTEMRVATTPHERFGELLADIGMFMAYEIARNLPLATRAIHTPLAAMEAPVLARRDIAVVPVLRAGLGMAEGVRRVLPFAFTGHIGLYRDAQTLRPVSYLLKLPRTTNCPYIIVDPMLATGFSAIKAVDEIKTHGVCGGNISYLSLLAAPEGVDALCSHHPDITVYTAALDDCLNDHAYIVPGLGDAGDRQFGTLE